MITKRQTLISLITGWANNSLFTTIFGVQRLQHACQGFFQETPTSSTVRSADIDGALFHCRTDCQSPYARTNIADGLLPHAVQHFGFSRVYHHHQGKSYYVYS